MMRFIVPGQPVGKARARTVLNRGKVHSFTPAKTANFENLVRLEFTEKYPGHVPVEGPISMTIRAYFEPPKYMKFKTVPAEQTPHAKRPDADNVYKAVADGLNGIAYRDDSQIATATIEKRYSLTPRTEIEVRYEEGK